MFKKILYFSLAIFMIIFLWTVNTQVKAMEGSFKKEIYINKTSSVNFILQNDERTFFKKGESLYLEGYSLDDILFFYNAKVKVVEKIEEGTNYYAYSSKLKYNEVIDGKIINLHIFIGKEKIILGFPVIFGSY